MTSFAGSSGMVSSTSMSVCVVASTNDCQSFNALLYSPSCAASSGQLAMELMRKDNDCLSAHISTKVACCLPLGLSETASYSYAHSGLHTERLPYPVVSLEE